MSALIKQAISRFEGVIDGDSIDWRKYLKPSDKARVVPVEALAERGKARLLLGADAEPGLSLPWPKTHGKVLIRDAKLALWTGWSRHGKTQMLKQIMLWAIRNDARCLVASMEEEVIEVWSDMAVIFCGTQEPSSAQIDKFIDFARGHLWLYDQQGEVKSDRLKAVIRYATEELKINQVMIDSLMMLGVPRDDYEAQSLFVGDLKTLAKDSGATIHLVAHMRKRDGKGGDHEPGSLHDISGGHEIGSKADYVFIPWRDVERLNPASPACTLKVEKARGRINWLGKIELDWHEGSRQFTQDGRAIQYVEEPIPL